MATFAVASVLLLTLWPSRGAAQDLCTPVVAEVTSAQGAVELSRSGGGFRPAGIGDVLCLGDTVRVGAYSRAALAFANNSTLRLDQRTTLQLRALAETRTSFLELLRGAVHIFSRQPRALTVETAYVNAGTEGTEFLISTDDRRTLVIVYEGLIRASNPAGEVLLTDGEAAVASAGAVPRAEVVVRPRDAVTWTLYYPPVLPALSGSSDAALPRALALAAERAGDGDHAAAIAALDEVPEAERDVRYWVLRAGVLLNVGRAEEAAVAIERALALEPEAGEALAERAVIRIARQDSVAALGDARRAVAVSPGSAAARIALSYALQANFQLDEARDILRAAAVDFPDDALVFARLAEVELALGYQDRALEAAERAVALAPELGRTQMVLGFAALARIDTDEARAAFERAIRLDSANPLPRLGLGLAIIRDGDLEAGRRQIEIAAGLDPGDGLIRSYLGKAYFEERRDPLAAKQLEIAKQLDPNDPTPWFYDAIRKQLENRPVEALRDLETAIDLNDNRAVYRSRLLLDQDLATRSVSLARIYDDLGFDQLAVTEASRSLSQDPANWSAHRFLSDAYARLPRHEIARVSELLQAQLLQPININPVQPSLAYSDLNVIAGVGPAEGAFNEFHPLFERNRAQLTATGVVGDGDGNEDTLGDELVVSALVDRFSLSAGQFHFETEGFRPNNDVEEDLYNLFSQWQVRPDLSVQAELRRRFSEEGDLALRFDPTLSFTERREFRHNVARVGARYQPSPISTVLLSTTLVDLENRLLFSDTFENGSGRRVTLTSDSTVEEDGGQIEAQYILDHDPYSLIAGGGAVRATGDVRETATEDDQVSEFSSAFDVDQENAYAYITLRLLDPLIWTGGIGFVSLDDRGLVVEEIEPKVGLEWRIMDHLRLRAAYLKAVKRPLSVDQTIEPTEIAGFNQFFDGSNGEISERLGIGLDAEISRSLFAGLEASRQWIESPTFDVAGNPVFEDRRQDVWRTYIYWAAHLTWAVTFDIIYEQFTSDEMQLDPEVPIDLETLRIPVGLRYFDPRGPFAQVELTYVSQDVRRTEGANLPEGSDDSVVVDAALGFRLPDRRGLISFEARNLFESDIRLQDDSFRVPPESINLPAFLPSRRFLLRATLSF